MPTNKWVGAVDIQSMLTTFPAKYRDNVVRRAVTKGMQPVLEQARSNISRYPKVASGLKLVVHVRGNDVIARVILVGPSAGFGNWIEHGTAAHTITAIRAQALHFEGRFAKVVTVSGIRPQPWARPAFEAKKNEAFTLTADHIGRYLTKQGLNDPPPVMEII